METASRRIQIETDALATFVFCGLVASFVAGGSVREHIGGRAHTVLLASSFLILFLSYSRNTLVALGAAVVVGLVAPIGTSPFSRIPEKINGSLRAFTLGLVAVIILAPCVWLAAEFGLGKHQIGTYSQRVVAGLRADSLQSDSSVRWRQTETQLAWDAVKRHEIVGHGLGVFYRPRLVNDIFSGNDGRLYVHNYYLRLLVKGGWIADHRLVFWTVDDVGERLLRLVLGCGLVGVLAAAVVAPWPAQAGLAGIVGFAVAFGWTHAWRTLPATGGAPVGELR